MLSGPQGESRDLRTASLEAARRLGPSGLYYIHVYIYIYIYINNTPPLIRSPQVKIHQREVQWKQGVVNCMMLYTSLLYNTNPNHCTPPHCTPL